MRESRYTSGAGAPRNERCERLSAAGRDMPGPWHRACWEETSRAGVLVTSGAGARRSPERPAAQTRSGIDRACLLLYASVRWRRPALRRPKGGLSMPTDLASSRAPRLAV